MSTISNKDIAIIGMACKFPKAGDYHQYWENLLARKSCISDIPNTRWDWRHYDGDPIHEVNKSNSRWGGFIDNVDCFDYRFFGISPTTAEAMDPQQRIILELSWACFEDAGVVPETLSGQNVGVYIGAFNFDYKELLEKHERPIEAYQSTGTANAIIANRISHFYDFNGPSVTVDSACSASMNAVHSAMQSLQLEESELALAGGINLILTPTRHISFSKTGMLSPTGESKSFDASADGYVRSEGAGLILLKPLAAALADNDQIHGVIKGGAVNHCGKTHTLTYPSYQAQSQVIARAMRNAQVSPDTMTYIEAHGTGTPKGDPIEIQGLQTAYQNSNDSGYCAIGSAKSNIGHLEAAAGIAGIIKVLLSMRACTLPGLANFRVLNPRIDLADSPFYILQETQPWQQRTDSQGQLIPKRAGVSAFGFGGTNGHIVLEEAPPKKLLSQNKAEQTLFLFVFSAKTEASLVAQLANMRDWFSRHNELSLPEVSATLYKHRTHFPKRVAVIANSLPALVKQLRNAIAAIATGEYSQPFYDEAHPETEHMFGCATQWLNNKDIEYLQVIPQTTQIVSLPSYAFEQTTCWFEPLSTLLSHEIASTSEATMVTQPQHSISKAKNKAGVGKCALVPRWIPLAKEEHSNPSLTLHQQGAVCVVGAPSSYQTVFARKYDSVHFFDAEQIPNEALSVLSQQSIMHVIWIPPMAHHNTQLSDQKDNLKTCFQWLQCLLHEGHCASQLCLTLLALQDGPAAEDIAFEHAPLVGLFGSLGKEYPTLNVRIFDMDTELHSLPLNAVFDIQLRFEGVRMYRNGQWLVRQFVPIEWSKTVSTADDKSPLCTQGGVYIIVGGAGGIGQAVTEYMLKHHSVRVIWLGRSEMNEHIRTSINRLDNTGAKLQYVKVDVTDFTALQSAYQNIVQQCGKVNGVINAAMVFKACSFKNMTFADFTAVYDVKAQSSVNLARLLRHEPLDYLVNFSSINSFITAAEQSHYAAGSLFQDSLSKLLQRVGSFQVKTINWGYWTAEGALADSDIFQYWRSKSGVGDLTITDAMATLEAVLRCELNQVAYINAQSESANLPNTQAHQRCYVDVDMGEKTLNLSDMNRFLTPATEQLAGGLKFPEADELTVQYMWRQLCSCGLFEGETLTLQSLNERFQDLHGTSQRSYLQRWLHKAVNLLREHQILTYQSADQSSALSDAQTSLSITEKGLQLATNEEILTQWAERQSAWISDPATSSQALLLDATLCALPAILTGEKRATEIMFPESSMQLLEGIYKYNPVSDYFNQLVADIVAHITRQGIAHGQKARMLEIGAGTGGTSALVFEKLKPLQAQVEEYCYTDISRAFLVHAHTHYQDHNPFLKTAIFNVEQPISEQTVSLACYDIVIATNVLHATRNIRNTLRNAKGLLKPGGMLILNELSEDSIFCHMTFGLLEGWWLHEDSEIRIPECPGLTSFGWKRALEQEGYVEVTFPQLGSHTLGQQVIVAKSDGVRFVQSQSDSAQTTNITPSVLSAETTKVNACDDAQPKSQSDVSEVQSMRESQRPAAQRTSQLSEMIKQVIADALKYNVNDIYVDESFADYGVDSITGVNVVKALNETLTLDLHSTCLFDYTNITRLVKYIESQLPDSFDNGVSAHDAVVHDDTQSRLASSALSPVSEPTDTDIAIVGMSGRFGKAENLQELWSALENGEDLVEPVRRWNLSHYYPDKDPSEYCDSGALLRNIDHFDPGFFNISPKEAAYMDPQQRLFMETCWHALEDAGITEQSIDGNAVSIYVGCEQGDYERLFADSPLPQSFWGNAPSIIPARLSYHLNLKGAAVAIDTACSSSLVAIHNACDSLRHRDVDMSIAGGVFVQSTPDFYLKSNRANMLSKSGKCYTFDDRADGFVPGEGVGVVVLKRLRDAIADNDRIYGVIKASGINQDGTSNGITAPSSVSQERLIKDTYDKFNINPEEVRFVEAHGTGTRLGDPIEYEALSRAFSHYTNKTGYSALGSIKTNLGHAATAAGMAGLFKILLSLQHKKIPASLNYTTGNSNIQFDGSPFYVNTELSEWESEPQQPRKAAISSFGFSGTNAHLVIEEAPKHQPTQDSEQHYLLCLSAKTAQQLTRCAEELLAHVQNGQVTRCVDLSYTLLNRRTHFEYRLAFTVKTLLDVENTLRQWLANTSHERVYDNIDSTVQRAVRPGYAEFAMQSLATAIEAQNGARFQQALEMLGQLFCDGETCDFTVLFHHTHANLITLPAYPFERKSIWLDEHTDYPKNASKVQQSPRLHPLLHSNVSTFAHQRFISHFDSHDYFLEEHVIHGKKILPGVSFVEMVRAALAVSLCGQDDKQLFEQQSLVLTDICWLTPWVLGESSQVVQVELYRDDGTMRFEISSVLTKAVDSSQPTVHCRGEVEIQEPAAQLVSAPYWPEQSNESLCLSSESVYKYFERCQIAYGKQFRCVSQLTIAGQQGYAEIVATENQSADKDNMFIEPGLFDGILQSAAVLIAQSFAISDALVPIAMEQLTFYGALNRSVRSHIEMLFERQSRTSVYKVNIDVFTEDGMILARIVGLSFRAMIPSEPSRNKVSLSSTPTEQTLQFSRSLQATDIALNYMQDQSVVMDKSQLIIVLEEREQSVFLGADFENYQPQLEQLCAQYKPTGKTEESLVERVLRQSTLLLNVLQLLMSHKYPTKIGLQVLIQPRIALNDIAAEVASVSACLSALLKTVELEDPRFQCQLIEITEQGKQNGTPPQGQALISALSSAGYSNLDIPYLQYKQQVFYRETWAEMPVITQSEAPCPWRDDAVYLITGGLGGIGYAIAEDIVKHTSAASILLLGSRQADDHTQQLVSRLNEQREQVSYHSVDVSKIEALNSFIATTRHRLKRVTILHCAGVTRDSLIAYKDPDALRQTYEPKIAGAVNIDNATQDLHIENVVLFSSVSAVLGNVGQGDYAVANKFMDLYASYRNQLTSMGSRSGHTIAINWPIWGTPGMTIDGPTLVRMHQEWGMSTMAVQQGLQTLYQVLQCKHDNVFVMNGVSERIRALFEQQQVIQSQNLNKAFLIAQASELLCVEVHELDPHLSFEEYGFDMIQLTALIDVLSAKLGGRIDKAALYSARSLDELDAYLSEHYDTYGVTSEAAKSISDKGKLAPSYLSDLEIKGAAELPLKLHDKVAKLLLELVHQHTDIASEDIKIDAHFERYGIDSLMVVSMTSELEQICGRLPKTLFFEYSTIAEMCDYLLNHYLEKLQVYFSQATQDAPTVPVIENESTDSTLSDEGVTEELLSQQKEQVSLLSNKDENVVTMTPKPLKKQAQSEQIAIVGIAGRYPKANSLHEFWQNLVQGIDAITEIPASRWDHNRYFDERKGVLGKTYSKWGGFIDGVDEFDPLFFNISPHDAEFMDPQERIFLQCAYHALEDAGYADIHCSQPGASKLGDHVGVFVGVMYSEYQLYGAQQGVLGTPISLGGSAASIANRVSFSLNFTGPSLAVDSMCSASLTSINLACESILNGQCDAAVAGGVNLNLHPNKYLNLAQGNFASSEGRCKSFGAGGNGYVPSEGCGAIILKPLSQALRDNDQIYGLIKASSINHAGKTNGYTVPSPNAQAEVISNAFASAGLDVATIGYIEAHGTGTSLGDPIEIAGLQKAFMDMTEQPLSCRIGSVKSNIGHCEGAAGIAGISKVLLQMKHQELVPSIHAHTLNPNIDFTNSPLQVQTSYEPWPRHYQQDNMLPYRAGVSSFGAGGSNAHIVLEEYPVHTRAAEHDIDTPLPFMLSAASSIQLQELVSSFLDWFSLGLLDSVPLSNIAYTLQVGRKALNERLVIIAQSRVQFIDKLMAYQDGLASKGMFCMNIKTYGPHAKPSASTRPNADSFAPYPWLLEWCMGRDIDIQEHWFAQSQVRRVSLPTYPFKKESYWYTSICTDDNFAQDGLTVQHLHPLLQRNTSDFYGVQYTNHFSAQEWFLRDHQVSAKKVMPGVAYLEMAVQAVKDAHKLDDDSEVNRLSLSHIIWRRAVVVDKQGCDIKLLLAPNENKDVVDFKVFHESTLCMTAEIYLNRTIAQQSLPSSSGKLQYFQGIVESSKKIAPTTLYDAFAQHGIDYGKTHRLIQTLHVNSTQALAKIGLTQADNSTLHTFILHPGLMDASLQIIKAFYLQAGDERLMVPFSCEQVQMHTALSHSMWVECRRTEEGSQHQFNIEVFNNKGELCVQFKKLSVMPYREHDTLEQEQHSEGENVLEPKSIGSDMPPEHAVDEAWDQYLLPRWKNLPVAATNGSNDVQRTTLVVELGDYSKALSVLQYNMGPSIALKETYSIDDIINKLNHAGEFEEIVCLAANADLHYDTVLDNDLNQVHTKLSNKQKGAALLCFNFIKALLHCGYANRALDIKLVTIHAFSVLPSEWSDPAYASLHGLFGCLAKEYSNWQVTAVDTDFISGLPIHDLALVERDSDGTSIAYRQGQWFAQQLYPYTPTVSPNEPYRQGGVYVVIGGAGGLGQVWSEMMVKDHQAHLIWIGRREQDEQISHDIEHLAQYGPKPWYISADASDLQAMREVLRTIKSRHPQIHGVVHSALVLQDKSLARMSQTEFLSCLSTKVDVSLCLAQTFKSEALDFALFFSSLIAFTRNPGQANYATGSVFEDVFAAQIDRHWSCKVRVINWGYWGSVGIVSDPSYRQRMAKAGIESIQTASAMAAIQHLLSINEPQLGFIRVNHTAQIAGVNEQAQITLASEQRDVLADIKAQFDLVYQDGSARKQTLSHISQLDQQTNQALAEVLLPLLCIQLRAAGLFTQGHISEVTQDTLLKEVQRFNLSTHHTVMFSNWLQYCVELLQQAGLLKLLGHEQLSLQSMMALNPDHCWQRWKQYCQKNQDNNLIAAKVKLLNAMLTALPDIITGKVKATDIMFPHSSMALVEGVYKNNEVSDYFNHDVSLAVCAAITAWQKQGQGRKLKILEIGAGTGGTSAGLLESLRPFVTHITEYCYTDVSQAFLNHAQAQYVADYPFVTTQLLNIEKPISEQGIAIGSYDIVIAAQVLHATKNISTTLANTKALLKCNGVLILNELSERSLYSHLTFGLLDGWWLYQDAALRMPYSPGISSDGWLYCLAAQGFSQSYFPAPESHVLGQQIVIATSDGYNILPKQVDSAKTAPIIAYTEARIENVVKQSEHSRERVTSVICEALSDALKVPKKMIDPTEAFSDYGLDSITGVNVAQTISSVLNVDLKTTALFDYVCIDQLARYVESLLSEGGVEQTSSNSEVIHTGEQQPSNFAQAPVMAVITSAVSQALKVPEEMIDPTEAFSDYGLDSITGVNVAQTISNALNVDLNTTVLFDHVNVEQLCQHILTHHSNVAVELAHSSAEEQSTTQRAADRPRVTVSTENSDAINTKNREMIQSVITQSLSQALKVPAADIDPQEAFSDYGLDSITGVGVAQQISQQLGLDLNTTILFDYVTVHQLAIHIIETYPQVDVAIDSVNSDENSAREEASDSGSHIVNKEARHESVQENKYLHEAIAVVGMSGRFPGSDTVDALWENIANGVELVTPLTRWDMSKYAGLSDDFCAKGGLLSDIEQFDPSFFNISGTEATYMDPQQRLFLQEAWNALENAGYAGDPEFGENAGVYVGCNSGDYKNILSDEAPAQAFWGNAGSITPARLSYYLNLNGPAVAVDTACSSSLVAIHLACQGLWSGELEVALAGGVFVQSTPEFYLQADRANMLSKHGRCQTFDAAADGFVPAEGVGVLILKRLSDALSDGDYIHGVIKGSGTNQDGASNGITAPSAKSQQKLIQKVHRRFSIAPEDIQLVEAHGTGTSLGDPIESEGLKESFKSSSEQPSGACALGSIKSNMGHAITAAGVASTIKVLMALKHRQLPPTIHFDTLNTKIDFTGTPFYVNTDLIPWEQPPGKQRTAAISSFGFSGTNAHLVLEEAPTVIIPPRKRDHYLFILSAHSQQQLVNMAHNLIAHSQAQTLDLAATSFTLLNGRKHCAHRLAWVASDQQELEQVLEAYIQSKNEETYSYDHFDRKAFKNQVSLQAYGKECVQRYMNSHLSDEHRDLLRIIADLFVQGYRIELRSLFLENECRRVPLPTYPFATKKYWAPTSEVVLSNETEHRQKSSEQPLSWLLTQTKYEVSPLRTVASWNGAVEQLADKTLYLLGNETQTADLAHLLNQLCEKAQLDTFPNVVRLSYQQAAKIDTLDTIPDHILCIDTLADTERQNLAGLQGLFQLVKTTMQSNWQQAVEVYYIYDDRPASQAYLDAMSGFYESVCQENNAYHFTMLQYQPQEQQRTIQQVLLQEVLQEDGLSKGVKKVQYRQGVRHVERHTEYMPTTDDNEQSPIAFQTGKTYLITGGFGPVGRLLCERLVKTWDANFVVLSRSALNDEQQALCAQLNTHKGRVYYYAVDICDQPSLQRTIQKIGLALGDIHGVIHMARLVHDNLLVAKSWQEFNDTIQAKVTGTVNLDQCLAQEPLDFFVLFSSIAAFGLRGGADYGYSAAFQNSFARYRNGLQAQGTRSGRCISQCWAGWTVDRYMPVARMDVMREHGMEPIDIDEAMRMFNKSLNLSEPVVGFVGICDKDKAKRFFGIEDANNTPPSESDQLDCLLSDWIVQKARLNTHDKQAMQDEAMRILSQLDVNNFSDTQVQKVYEILFSDDIAATELASEAERSSSVNHLQDDLRNIQQTVFDTVKQTLMIDELSVDESLQYYGMDSVSAMQISSRLSKTLGKQIEPVWLVENPTINEFSNYLKSQFVDSL
uniref:SDR family NAD(P)-dependent oxidoreductase n=1 Tax=Pseudoalteromonas sp. (strain SANK 73390) TaxID=747457 RepID=UPI000211AE5B|nr:SDR family NAD(P)-dependent oxidoreductase [Pseudoalteromonas sp. SANK 73390]CBK62733.1 tmpD [Pseudoalteromonas sp. SANK 73390]